MNVQQTWKSFVALLQSSTVEVLHGSHVCQTQSTDMKYGFIKEGGTLKLTINMAAVKYLY